MTDRELKNALKNAYIVETSEREKAFLTKYEKRSMQIFDVLRIELKYMGVKNFCAGLFWCIVLFLVARLGEAQFMWILSSALPMCVLIPLIAIGRSERYGMGELEASSRFSLRFLRMTRMLILGFFGLILISVTSLVLREFIKLSPVMTVCFVGFPYLVNVWGCLLVTRKWNAKENLYGCMGITCISCLMPFVAHQMELMKAIEPAYVPLAMIVVLVVTVKESILYIRESEDFTWSLC